MILIFSLSVYKQFLLDLSCCIINNVELGTFYVKVILESRRMRIAIPSMMDGIRIWEMNKSRLRKE